MNKNTLSRTIVPILALTWVAACDSQLTTTRPEFTDHASRRTEVPPALGTHALAGAADNYKIELVSLDGRTRQYAPAILRAATRWWQVVRYTELRDVIIPPGPKHDCNGINIDDLSGAVDELVIVAWVTQIDGAGGTMWAGDPCFVREEDSLPFMGSLFLDAEDIADLDDGTLEDVLVHQIGHILGIGSLWPEFNLLQSPSSNSPGADTHFSGPLAVAAFDAAGGTNYRRNKVPVDNTGRSGVDRHWRESVFGSEVMTPVFWEGESRPLSAITARSLEDLGYTVNAELADAFTLPNADRGASPADADLGRAISMAADASTGRVLAFGAGESVARRPRR